METIIELLPFMIFIVATFILAAIVATGPYPNNLLMMVQGEEGEEVEEVEETPPEQILPVEETSAPVPAPVDTSAGAEFVTLSST